MVTITTLLIILTFHLFECERIIFFDKFFEKCPDVKNQIGNYTKLEVSLKSNIFSYQFDFNTFRDYPPKFKVLVMFTRCSNKENPDTCMKLNNLQAKNVCDMMAAKNEFWTTYIKCIHPEIKCPVKKTIYLGRNCTLDLNTFKIFPLGNSYWKTKIIMSDVVTNEILTCLLFEGSMKSGGDYIKKYI